MIQTQCNLIPYLLSNDPSQFFFIKTVMKETNCNNLKTISLFHFKFGPHIKSLEGYVWI